MIKEKRRECAINVKSLQRSVDGETQVIETESRGWLSGRAGVLYVLYEENPEGTQEKPETASEISGKAAQGMLVKNLLKIEERPLRINLKKSGAVSWETTFEQGRKSEAEYVTPCGMLKIGTETEGITLKKEQEKISLQLLYALFMQGEKQADCRLEMEIR